MEFDFIASLKYRTTKDGGRKTPAKSGYRPQVKFPFEVMTTSGQQIFLHKEMVNPGETIVAGIKMLSPGFFENRLEEGMDFEFTEGSTIIGTGTIARLINVKLKKQ